MREEHFNFTSAEGKVRIHGVKWIPEGEVRAVLQLVHGMAEHVERYREFARFLTLQGILVVGHDHLGHGASVHSQEDFGYFAEKYGNRVLVQDMHRVLQKTKKEYPDVPYVMFGHSMGSFLARQFLCCYGTELDGAVICGTGYHPEWLVRAALALCRMEAAVFGWRYRSRLFRFMMSDSFNLQFRPNRTTADWLCKDEEIVDGYVADEKCGFSFTLNGNYNLFLTLLKIGRKEYLERMPRELPVLFISGKEDPVGSCGKGVTTVAKLFDQVGMKNVNCILYPEDRHEILNEPDRDKVYADVLAWMQKNVL